MATLLSRFGPGGSGDFGFRARLAASWRVCRGQNHAPRDREAALIYALRHNTLRYACATNPNLAPPASNRNKPRITNKYGTHPPLSRGRWLEVSASVLGRTAKRLWMGGGIFPVIRCLRQRIRSAVGQNHCCKAPLFVKFAFVFRRRHCAARNDFCGTMRL